jgi:hypothetical protein
MMTYIWVIISTGIVSYPQPSPAAPGINLPTAAVMTWFRIELMAFFGIIFSNISF